MSHKKTILFISFLAVFGVLFSFNTPQVVATAPWCYNFNKNLKIGDRGDWLVPEMAALDMVLIEMEGLPGIDPVEKAGKYFGQSAAAAVTAFQEKYRDQILRPINLPEGNGYFGPRTRVKMNDLYGCARPPAPGPIPYSENFEAKTINEFPSGWYKYLASPDSGDIKVVSFENQKVLGISSFGKQVVAQTPKFSVKPRSSYQLTNDLKLALERGAFYVQIYCYDSAGFWLGVGNRRTIQKHTSSLGDLTRQEYSFIPANLCPSNVNAAKISLVYKWYGVGGNSQGNALVDNIEVREITNAPSINVTSPAAGAQWAVGSTQTIRWQSANLPANSTIKISLSNRTPQVPVPSSIAFGLPSTQTQYSWTIPPGAALGTNYIIFVSAWPITQQPAIAYDESDQFSIVAPTTTPSITVISPNGGNFFRGQAMNITWSATNITNPFNILLMDYDTTHPAPRLMYLATGLSASARSYSWVVPVNATFGAMYKINIIATQGGQTVIDESDNYFSIVAPTPTPVISNAGFETGTLSPWLRWGGSSCAVSSEKAQSGSNSLKCLGNSAWKNYYQQFLLTAGNTYKFKGYALTSQKGSENSWNGAGAVGLYVCKSNNNWQGWSCAGRALLTEADRGNWAPKEIRFIAEQGYSYRLAIDMNTSVTNGNFYFDNLSLSLEQLGTAGVPAVGGGLEDIENQLASISSAVSDLLVKLGELLGR